MDEMPLQKSLRPFRDRFSENVQLSFNKFCDWPDVFNDIDKFFKGLNGVTANHIYLIQRWLTFVVLSRTICFQNFPGNLFQARFFVGHFLDNCHRSATEHRL